MLRFSSLLSNKEKDRNDLQTLEKRLKAETESRDSTEKLLQEEKRRRKEDEATATIALNNRYDVILAGNYSAKYFWCQFVHNELQFVIKKAQVSISVNKFFVSLKIETSNY